MRSLAGRVVVVTGGARGIGAATAQKFAEAGCKVALGDVDVDLAIETATKLGGFAGELDVSDRGSFEGFLDSVAQGLGPVDILINNAGIMPVTPFLEESAESIQRQLAINVAGVIHGTQLASQRMRARGAGHIVNVASAAGRMGFGGVATYSATKFAVAGFTDAVALELAGAGIGFTTVYPGMVKTELAKGLSDHWLMRTCEPETVAAAIVDGVRRDRRSVYVPRRIALAAMAYGALPGRARTRLMTMMGADHQMLAGDRVERADYDRRIGRA